MQGQQQWLRRVKRPGTPAGSEKGHHACQELIEGAWRVCRHASSVTGDMHPAQQLPPDLMQGLAFPGKGSSRG